MKNFENKVKECRASYGMSIYSDMELLSLATGIAPNKFTGTLQETFDNPKRVDGISKRKVLGLLWQDVDFEQGAIFVQHSLAHVVGKGAVMQEPKTKNSCRRVLLLPEDVASLRKYRDWQQAYAVTSMLGGTWYLLPPLAVQ